jgi:hypothetical protein
MLGLPSASDREVRKSSDLDKAPVTVEQRHSRRHSIDLVSASTFVPPFATMPASRIAGRWGPFDGCPNRHLTTNRGVEAALRQPPGGTIFKSPSTGDLAASWRPYRRNARFRCQFVQDSASKMRPFSGRCADSSAPPLLTSPRGARPCRCFLPWRHSRDEQPLSIVPGGRHGAVPPVAEPVQTARWCSFEPPVMAKRLGPHSVHIGGVDRIGVLHSHEVTRSDQTILRGLWRSNEKRPQLLVSRFVV